VRAEVAFREARFYVEYLLGRVPAARQHAQSLLQRVDSLPGLSERIGSRAMVADLYLLDGDFETAGTVIVEALALCDVHRRASGGDGRGRSRGARQHDHQDDGGIGGVPQTVRADGRIR
jgi:hypothetical protein